MANNNTRDKTTLASAMSKKSGVRRVNNRPLYILLGILGAFLLVMIMVANNRGTKRKIPGQCSADKTGSTSTLASKIAGDHTEGIIQPAVTPVESGAAPPIKMGEPDHPPVPFEVPSDFLDMLPKPVQNIGRPAAPKQDDKVQRIPDGELERIRTEKMQFLQEAIKAKTGVNISIPQRSNPVSAQGTQQTYEDKLNQRMAELQRETTSLENQDPSDIYMSQLKKMKDAGLMDGQSSGFDGSSFVTASTPSRNVNSNGYKQFDNKGSDRWQLNTSMEAPRSLFELRAGFVVPGIMISGINSDLPGQIMAQVSQNVYDTATGKYLLIPQGSRLVGSYSSSVLYGQSRVLVAWQRIVFPDGKAMDIGSMPGGDGAGYSGFNDKVNNHYFRLFSSALLMSGITAGVAYSQDRNGSNKGPTANGSTSQSMNDMMSAALGQQLGQVTAQLIAKNLNISPTIEIRPGYRFNIIVTKDITFSKPYQSFDYRH
jgi:type IV secretory pathway VirB10-like protein